MAHSMTGYGSARLKDKDVCYVAEAKSVNNRYCEVHVFVPRELMKAEHLIEKLVRKSFSRGKFDVSVRLEGESGRSMDKIVVDRVNRHWHELEQLRKHLKLTEPVSLETMIHLNRQWFLSDRSASAVDEKKLLRVVGLCLEKLQLSRAKEGQALMKVMQTQLKNLAKAVGQIDKCVKQSPEQRMRESRQRIEKLLQHDDPNLKKRVEVEVALLIDRSDVTEELDRLKTHIDQMFVLCSSVQTVGREMDFVIQELNREINTIGSKTNSIKAKEWVVMAKSEIEKMREQAQNVE